MLLTCASFAVIVILLTLLGLSFWRKKIYGHFPGKKPGIFNVLGDIADLWQAEDAHQGFLDIVRNRVEQFKKEKLYCFWILYEPFIVFIKADAVQELLMGIKMNDRHWVYELLQSLLGTGLLTSEGAKWKSRRKLLAPCFNHNILRNFMTAFNEGAQKLVTSLQEETKNDFTLISNHINIFTLDILFKTMFDVQIDTLKNEFSEYVASLKRFTDLMMRRLLTPWNWPSIIYWNSKCGKEFKHLCQFMQQVTRKIIREKRERYLRGEIDISPGKHKALVDLLMQKHFETQELSEEDIREEVDTFTAAGYETVSTSIVWALYLIGLYPDIQDKLHEEIDEVFGNDAERDVTEEDLQSLEYLDCVLKESNRLYSAVPMYARKSNEDTTICGYTIPKGTGCVVLSYFLHRDEDVFPDPEAFKPERFLPEFRANIPPCAFIPFSAGPRKCIGYKFAEMEMKVLVSSILRNFTLESLDERSKVRPLFKVTLQPSCPIRIRFRSIFDKKDL